MMLRAFQVPHAERLLSILRDSRSAMDGSDCGTGKSYVGSWLAGALGLRTLVICPLSVVPVWRTILASAGVKDFTVCNYEMAWRKLGRKVPWGSGSFFEWSATHPLFIFDEAHRCQSSTTMQGKMLIAAKRQAMKSGGSLLVLSATAADSLLKLGPVGFSVGLHSLSNYREWLFAYGAKEVPIYGRGGRPVLMKNGQPAKKIEIGKRENAAAMTKLHDQIFGSGMRGARMRIADIPDFPKTQIEVRLLDGASKELERLSAEVMEFYKQRNTLAQFTEDELAKLVFWRQAAEVAKIPHFLDMAEDALETSKVACFVNFNRTMDELLAEAEKRKWKTGFIRGEQSATDRQKTIDLFQANRLDLIVCNIQAGGVGVSLHDPTTQYPRTSLICPTWRAVDLKQVFGRPHRDGGGPSRQFLVCWSTGIESRVAASAQAKLDRLDLLNDGELAGETEIQPELSLRA